MIDLITGKRIVKLRESGIELLKIFGILLVVLSHVVQTLGDYVNISYASKSPTVLALGVIRLSGNLGNIIFFFCSAWFLVDSKKTNTQKVMRMLADIFVISVIWWVMLAGINGGGYYFNSSTFRTILFPTYHGNNWYLSTYVIFCFIYPILNTFIKTLDQKKHLLMASGLFFIYIIIGMRFDFYGTSDFFIWISFYVMISYLKKYSKKSLNNKTVNGILLLIGILGAITLNLFTHFLGLKFGYKKNKMMRWNRMTNIFLILIAFSCLNLFRQMKFKSSFINYISGLSLLVYIIHENILFRRRIRTIIWEWILNNLNMKLLFVWIAIYTLVLFVISVIVASFYKETIQKIIYKMSDDIHDYLSRIVNKTAEKIQERS